MESLTSSAGDRLSTALTQLQNSSAAEQYRVLSAVLRLGCRVAISFNINTIFTELGLSLCGLSIRNF